MSEFYEDMRRALLGQLCELLDVAERHTWTDDAEERCRTQGAINYARHVMARYNYNGTNPPPQAMGGVRTVFVYRQPDGVTQVRAPDINDADVVVDMLNEAQRAMTEGEQVVAQ